MNIEYISLPLDEMDIIFNDVIFRIISEVYRISAQ